MGHSSVHGAVVASAGHEELPGGTGQDVLCVAVLGGDVLSRGDLPYLEAAGVAGGE